MIANFTDQDEPHRVSMVNCHWCNCNWVAIYPVGTRMLDCPKCSVQNSLAKAERVMFLNIGGER